MRRFERGFWLSCALGGAALGSAGLARADECTPPLGEHSTEGYTLTSSSFLGGAGADRVWAAVILGDGTVVLGGRFTTLPAAAAGAPEGTAFGAGAGAAGVVLGLSADGQQVKWVTHVGADVFDLGRDGAGNIHVALGEEGLGSLDAGGGERWHVATAAARLDVADDGTVAVLDTKFGADHTPAAKSAQVHIFTGAGAPKAGPIAGWGGREHSAIAIHDSAEQVYVAGFHITASCKNPVHVAFIRAWDFAGNELWTNYGWAGNDLDPSCSAFETNNMADTRGYLLEFGDDGKLYAGFEAAGGNHIFRYDPKDLVKKVDGLRTNTSLGNHAEMFNTKSEHKTVIARYEPATGELLKWQQWVARLTGYCGTGAGNTIRTKAGGLAADSAGRVYLTGASASGLRLTHEPFLDDPYRGGFYMTVFGPDLDMTPYSTRHFGGGQGHAVAVRDRPGESTPMVVFAGGLDKADFNYTHAAIQDANLGDQEGALVILNAATQLDPDETTGGPDTTTGEPDTTTGPDATTGGPDATTGGVTSTDPTGGEAGSGGAGESGAVPTGDAPTGGGPGGATSTDAASDGDTAGQGDDAGCGCRSDGAGGAGLLGLAALGLLRRRRLA